MSTVLPHFIRAATAAECHLSEGGERRALLSKAFSFYCVNILFVLAFGRASLTSLAQIAADCGGAGAAAPSPPPLRATPPPPHEGATSSCASRFLHVLGSMYIDTSSASVFGVLVTAAFVSNATDLIDPRVLLRRALTDSAGLREPLLHAPAGDSGDGSGGDESSSDNNGGNGALPSSAPRTRRGIAEAFVAWYCSPTPHSDVFATAHDACLLAVVLCFSPLAPLVTLPGALFFAFRWAATKWNAVACVAPPAPPTFSSSPLPVHPPPLLLLPPSPASSDGRLASAAAGLMRWGAALHAASCGAFVLERGGGGARARVFAAPLLAASFLIAASEAAGSVWAGGGSAAGAARRGGPKSGREAEAARAEAAALATPQGRAALLAAAAAYGGGRPGAVAEAEEEEGGAAAEGQQVDNPCDSDAQPEATPGRLSRIASGPRARLLGDGVV